MASQIRSDSPNYALPLLPGWDYALYISFDFSFKEFSDVPIPKVRSLNSNVSSKGTLLNISMIAWTIKFRWVRFE